MRRVLGGTLALLLALGLAACAPADDPEPTPTALTGEQSERLAIARFRNFDAGVRAIEARIPSTSGDLIVSGWFDYTNVAGYAGVTVDEVPSGLVWWNHDLVATRDPAPGRALLGRGPGVPVRDGQVLAPGQVHHVIDVTVGVDLRRLRFEGQFERVAGRDESPAQASIRPCSARRVFSSPDWNISRTMSLPPMNSPLT